jgi:hypothetical protein
VLVLDAEGVARIEQRLTLREGEQERRLTVTFAATASPPAVVAPAPAPAPAPEAATEPAREPAREAEPARQPQPAEPQAAAEPERPVPTLAYVLGGSGLLATAVGGYFQASGMSKRSDLGECAPRCTQADVDDARNTLWAGNIVLGAGVLALGAALYVYLTRPAVDGRGQAVHLDAHGVRGGAVGGFTARF